jgi:2-octaprenylphenol hydroxylase
MSVDYDVLVIGGGPVGAALGALLLREAGFVPPRVAVLEREALREPLPGDPVDLRVSAFSRASARILRSAGAWPALETGRRSRYERMRVWHASSAFAPGVGLEFDAAQVSEPDLGCIIENRLVQHALLRSFSAAGGCVIADSLLGLEFLEDHVAVAMASGQVSARLLVGADGGRSRVRELAGLGARASSYGQSALVCIVATGRPHERTAWQRFLGDGTLAFLPLADGRSSIVWSLDTPEAERLQTLPREQFENELAGAIDHALGPVRLEGERALFELSRLSAAHYVRERCALVGDAAHVVHPLAGQGVNLGLLDAAALAEVLCDARARREDPGALGPLRRYERWRRSENELMSSAMDAFNRFLATGSGPLSRLAQRGLGWVGRSPELRRLFIERALGLAGDLPRSARA